MLKTKLKNSSIFGLDRKDRSMQARSRPHSMDCACRRGVVAAGIIVKAWVC